MVTTEKSQPIITNAYAVVSGDEESATVATAVVDLQRPAVRCVPPAYAHIPETKGLTWTDEFFDDDEDVVAVFDFDYDRMVAYYAQLSWAAYIASIFIPNCFMWGLFCWVPCSLNQNVNWAVRSQHVCLTREGVRFVHEKRHTLHGFDCTDIEKNTKTIPYDKIIDCDFIEPSGSTCFCVVNTLDVVNVDTAGRTEGQKHELVLVGLKNPRSFKKMLLAMKQNYGTSFDIPASAAMLDRATLNATDGSDVASILRDIREELRQHNAVLQTLKTAPEPVTATFV